MMSARGLLGTSRAVRCARAPAKRSFSVVPSTASRIAPSTPRLHAVTPRPLRVGQAAARTFRSFGASKEDHHEMSPRGTKLWTFEQVQKASQGERKVVIVDTREPGELVQTGRIPGAINIPITTHPESFHVADDEFEVRFDYPRPGRDEELVFYCKAGVRSRAAATLAKEAGWTNVGEYPGSWLDWEKNGGEAEKVPSGSE